MRLQKPVHVTLGSAQCPAARGQHPNASLPSGHQNPASWGPPCVIITEMGLTDFKLPTTSPFPLSNGLVGNDHFTLRKGFTQIKDAANTSLSLGEERNHFNIQADFTSSE